MKMDAAPWTRRIMEPRVTQGGAKYHQQGQEYLRPFWSDLFTDPVDMGVWTEKPGQGRVVVVVAGRSVIATVADALPSA
jgi:hypothetical protein